MRIRNSGSSFFGFGGGDGNRSESFKRGKRLGQKVRGTLLKWVSQDMAWVEIDGQKLLAQLHSKPPVGARLTFIIKQLSPEIILKEIFEAPAAGVRALSMAGDFEAARTLFESQLQPSQKALVNLSSRDRLSTFTTLLSENKKLLYAFLDTATCLTTINAAILSDKPDRLSYTPWLVPAARRFISISRPKGESTDLTESIIEFDLHDFGMVRIEFLFKSPTTSFRLKLQHPSKGKKLVNYITNRQYGDLQGDIQCLGISPLPQSGHGGILAEVMFRR